MFVYLLLLFFLGASLGSFVNVLIDRVPKGRSIWVDRSECDACQRKLRWFELIPLLSFVIQKGRCRRCGVKLSFMYPVLEIVTGVIVTIFLYTTPLPYAPKTIVSLIFILILIAISVVDFRSYIIPQQFIIALVVIFSLFHMSTFIVSLFSLGVQSEWLIEWSLSVASQGVWALCASGFLYLLVLITKGMGMGGGDVQLAFVMGLFLTGMETLVAMYTAFVLGAGVGVILLLIGKRKFGQVIPFGPFLALGSFIALVMGSYLTEFYLTVMSFQ